MPEIVGTALGEREGVLAQPAPPPQPMAVCRAPFFWGTFLPPGRLAAWPLGTEPRAQGSVPGFEEEDLICPMWALDLEFQAGGVGGASSKLAPEQEATSVNQFGCGAEPCAGLGAVCAAV